MYENYGILIDNEWRQAKSGKTMPVYSPASEELIGEVPLRRRRPTSLAVLDSAARGFKTWRATAAWDRAKIMRRAAELIRERNEAIARIMSSETGKPLAEARGEINGTADHYEWYAEEGKRVYGQTHSGPHADQRLSVIYQPVGVCLSLSAWNFPALLPSRKIAAALGAGCSVIARPASEAPGSCLAIAQALVDAGLPPGVISVITGPPPSSRASSSPRRSSARSRSPARSPSARASSSSAPTGVKRVSMELGGHAPVIVHRDADPVGSAKASAAAKFRNAGQVCISPTRFYRPRKPEGARSRPPSSMSPNRWSSATG